MYVNSQGALNSRASSRARQLTKDLGACSPRETHMKEPTSAHELSSYVLLVGMPICPSARKQALQASGNLRRKTTRQGTNTLCKAKTPRQAKSKHLVEFPFAGFCPSSLFSLSYASWAACALKGNPRHRASGVLLLEASRTPRPCGALTLTYRSGGGVALREGPKT